MEANMQKLKMKKLSIAALSLLLFMVCLSACATATPPPLSPDDLTASPGQYGSSAPDSDSQMYPYIIILVLVAGGIAVMVGSQKRAQRIQNWRKLATELGAKYIDGKGRVQLDYKHWIITLDLISVIRSYGKYTSPETYTRLRAPYVDKDGFQFLLYQESLLRTGGPLEFRKMDEVKTEAAVFDDSHSVRSTDPATVQTLLVNPKIHENISQQLSTLYRLGTIHELSYHQLGLRDESLPEGVNEVYIELSGWVTEIDQLKSMFELTEEMLDQLCQLGSASEDKPDFAIGGNDPAPLPQPEDDSHGHALDKFVQEINSINLDQPAEVYLRQGMALLEKSEFDNSILEFIKVIKVSKLGDNAYQGAKDQLQQMGFSESDIGNISK
jgi:hypothetical protein